MIAKRDVAFVIASLVQFTVLLAAAILATLIPSGIHAGEPSRDAWYWNSKVNLHIDNHSGLVGKGHSVEELTDMVRDLPVSLIQVSAFGANGVTTYPTEIRPNPDQGDWDTLAAWRQVAKNLNKRFCIYINTRGLSLPTTHPDWMQRDAQGKGRGKGRPDWRDVCARPSADGTGVVEQVLLPLLKEIVTRYEPDGIWVDGDHARTAVCYCPHCVDAWKAETGKDRPPTNSDDPDWPRWLALEQARFDAYRRQMADVIHAVRPSCMYTSNHSWRFRSKDPRNAPAHVDTLSGDLSHGAALDLTRLSVMQISAEERLPCDVMHNVSRVSRQEASFRRILQMGGITMTSGGAWFLWVPGSTIVQPEMQERARQCAAFVVARDDALGRSNSANQTAVLLSETSWAMEHVQGHADTYGASTAEAAALALQDAGHCVDMVNESILGERIENYRTVVIANQGAVAPATLTALQSFVNRGGLLLVTGSGLRSAPDGEDRNVSELLGLVRDSDARRPLRVRLAGGPTVIQTRWSVTPDAAEVLIHDREGRAVLTRNRSGRFRARRRTKRASCLCLASTSWPGHSARQRSDLPRPKHPGHSILFRSDRRRAATGPGATAVAFACETDSRRCSPLFDRDFDGMERRSSRVGTSKPRHPRCCDLRSQCRGAVAFVAVQHSLAPSFRARPIHFRGLRIISPWQPITAIGRHQSGGREDLDPRDRSDCRRRKPELAIGRPSQRRPGVPAILPSAPDRVRSWNRSRRVQRDVRTRSPTAS